MPTVYSISRKIVKRLPTDVLFCKCTVKAVFSFKLAQNDVEKLAQI